MCQNRVIAYYEQDDAQPPGPLLAELARVLKASTDELLGLQPVKDGTSPRTARLLKRLRKVEALPTADQRAVLKMIEALLQARQSNSRR